MSPGWVPVLAASGSGGSGAMLNNKAVIETMSWLFESMDRGMSTMDQMADSMQRMEIYMLMLVMLMYGLTIVGVCGIAMHLLSRHNAKKRKRASKSAGGASKSNRVNHSANHHGGATGTGIAAVGGTGIAAVGGPSSTSAAPPPPHHHAITPANKHSSAHSIYQIKPTPPEQAV